MNERLMAAMLCVALGGAAAQAREASAEADPYKITYRCKGVNPIADLETDECKLVSPIEHLRSDPGPEEVERRRASWHAYTLSHYGRPWRAGTKFQACYQATYERIDDSNAGLPVLCLCDILYVATGTNIEDCIPWARGVVRAGK